MKATKMDISLPNIKLAEWSHKLSTVRSYLNDVSEMRKEAGQKDDDGINELYNDTLEILDEVSGQIGKNCKYE